LVYFRIFVIFDRLNLKKLENRIFCETPRFILREVVIQDKEGLFILDTDPEVHRFLGNQSVISMLQIEKMIESLQMQYRIHGIGRWAIIEKSSGEFVGWSGLKLVKDTINSRSHFFDLGYRIIRSHWGKGIAYETSLAALRYGFETLKLNNIYASAQEENHASLAILSKLGFKKQNRYYDFNAWQIWHEMHDSSFNFDS